MKKNKGFTLIELLVVIAIIGILASVVLASLSAARNKGADASIKSNLANMRAQAEVYLDGTTNKNYAGLCSDSTIAAGIAAAKAASGSNDVVCTVDSSTNLAWAVSARMKSDSAKYWCVDNTGVSKEEDATHNTSSGSVKCI